MKIFFIFWYFHEHFLNSAEDNFCCVFLQIFSLFPEEKFYLCEDFLLVLTFFVRIFSGKIAQNLREFTILFGNNYEWSGALVKFNKVFFSAQILCLYSLTHNMR